MNNIIATFPLLLQALSPEKAMTGAMTYTFVKAVKDAVTNNQIITYRGILDSLNKTLDKDSIAGCLHPRISRVFQRKIFQACPSFS